MGSSGSPKDGRRSGRLVGIAVLAVCLFAAVCIALWYRVYRESDLTFSDLSSVEQGGLTIVSPIEETLFPPGMAAPSFRWIDSRH